LPGICHVRLRPCHSRPLVQDGGPGAFQIRLGLVHFGVKDVRSIRDQHLLFHGEL
jgi:hypothetical protein